MGNVEVPMAVLMYIFLQGYVIVEQLLRHIEVVHHGYGPVVGLMVD
jgi:hypothetical protein